MIELKDCTLTYDQPQKAAAPQAGEYLVSIGAKTGKVGTVYHIRTVRVVRPRTPRNFVRYHLEVTTCPGIYQSGNVIYQASKRRVWVAGKPARPLFWYPRNKKKRKR